MATTISMLTMTRATRTRATSNQFARPSRADMGRSPWQIEIPVIGTNRMIQIAALADVARAMVAAQAIVGVAVLAAVACAVGACASSALRN